MRTVHIVGAGLAGLACAVRLSRPGASDSRIVLYDAAGHAGGRCRSFFDDAIERTIDNGNHLLLSGNTAVQDYLDEIGAGDSLVGPNEAVFPFIDIRTGERWAVRPNAGRLPWWILAPRRRVPGSRATDYIAALRLARAGPHATVTECLDRQSTLFTRFWEPLTVSALNTPVEQGAARLLWHVVAETFGRGGAACRPRVVRQGLSESFVAPAMNLLQARGVEFCPGHRLRRLTKDHDRIVAIDFGTAETVLEPQDTLVLALPPTGISTLLPGIAVPDDSHVIVNGHFRLDHAPSIPDNVPFLGIVGGVAQWLFLRGDIVSITVSAADALSEEPAEGIAAKTWLDVSRALDLPSRPIPPYRIIKEKRATFAQTPKAAGQRPGTRTAFRNLFLAGDWTDTKLPATIEGALRSGFAAACAVMSHQPRSSVSPPEKPV